MPYFKDTSGGLHFLDDVAFIDLLQIGSVEITDAQAEAILTPAPTLAKAQGVQIVTINSDCQVALAAIVAQYPSLEVSTWPQQYAEAIAYTASNTATIPMLSAIATASNATVASVAATVLAKAAAYVAASGAAVGKRIALTAQIEAATTVAAVQAIIW